MSSVADCLFVFKGEHFNISQHVAYAACSWASKHCHSQFWTCV